MGTVDYGINEKSKTAAKCRSVFAALGAAVLASKPIVTVASCFILLSMATAASASVVTIEVSEVGENVIFVGSGSVDLSGRSGEDGTDGSGKDKIYDDAFGVSSTGNYRYWFGYSNTETFNDPLSNFGTIGFDSFSGDEFYVLYNGNVWLDPDSVNSVGGEYDVSFTYTINGQTISSLGVNFGTMFTGEAHPSSGGKTLTVKLVEASSLAPVPLPASVLFLGAGLGGFGLMGRLRRRKVIG